MSATIRVETQTATEHIKKLRQKVLLNWLGY